jgi:hypothetical protein
MRWGFFVLGSPFIGSTGSPLRRPTGRLR